ncbi:MAG: N-6 DNA methylase [Thermoflexales bacterium]|nr:N-6 DNA methylase [Thermoflexales bacterium]
MPDYAAIKSIQDFESLVGYLHEHLDWPIVEEEDVEDLAFDYEPEELGLDEQAAVKVRAIKQIRPLVEGQPWGVFWIDFEPKRLPVVVMRRVLAALVRKKRGSKRSRQAVWDLDDLMFISATGQGRERGISFAHFHDTPGGLPQLRTFSWDADERHFYYLEKLNLEALRWPDDTGDAEAWREQWDSAFVSAHRETITTSQALASRMAELAAATRALVNEVYEYEKATGVLHRLHESFRRALIHDLSVDDFADMYAQTVTYGLFSARATRTGEFAPQAGDVAGLIPNTSPFLRDLFAECLKVGGGRRGAQVDMDELGVGELVDMLRGVNMEAVLRDFGRQSKEHKEDPVVHFYESFLREYDPDKKARRGVFYTPDSVVSFIVRSVDYLLRTEFGCPDGLADTGEMAWKGQMVPKVQILDPATGTGTFLNHVIEQIYDTFTRNAEKAGLRPMEIALAWNEYVARHLLPRLYGFELMMAPYAVAHMKLGLALQQTGYDFGSDERLRVYLTNTLQPAHEVPRVDTPSLAHEAEEANRVKTEVPVTVIIGNPPYSGHSANKGEWIGSLVRSYYQVDGASLGERNPKWLQDDYVKFIRFAQWRIEQAGAGIVAMITNHGYLDNPTFRGMRQQLLGTFDDIYVSDLHGNTKKKETAPDGGKDENVFDIQQGVAILLAVKHSSSVALARGERRLAKPIEVRVHHADLYGIREGKYDFLASHDVSTVEWMDLQPTSPFYLFVPQNVNVRTEYEQGWKITEVMPVNVLGFQSHRDYFAIDLDRAALRHRIKEMRDTQLSDDDFRRKYEVPDNRDWKLSVARARLRRNSHWEDDLIDCLYRPFDIRPTYFSEVAMDYPRLEVTRHLLKPNLAFNLVRQTKAERWQHALVSDCPTPAVFVEVKDGSSIFPLYLYTTAESTAGTLFAQTETTRVPNFAPTFIRTISDNLNLTFIPDGMGDLRKTFGPEDVFHYMYAVFHSPTYRTRYAEFLKIDFPRLPLTRDLGLFRTLAGLGAELVGLHLLESPALDKPITRFVGRGDDVVARGYPKYDDSTVWMNAGQGFQGVPEEVWEFHVGGYQVCHKWLKDRRGYELDSADKAHYARIVVALRETIRLMDEIDAAIPAWPVE